MLGELFYADWRQIPFELGAKPERGPFNTSIHPVGQARNWEITLENSVPHPHINTSSPKPFFHLLKSSGAFTMENIAAITILFVYSQ